MLDTFAPEWAGIRTTLTAAASAQTSNVLFLSRQPELGHQSGAQHTLAEDDLGTRKVVVLLSVDSTGERVSPESGGDSDLPSLPPPDLPPVASLVIGSSENEELSGTVMADYIEGREGDDVLKGGYGNDYLFGGDGSDELRGGKGVDELHGGAGDDDVLGGAGADLGFGGDGDDFLVGASGKDYLFGGAGNDELRGGNGADELHGGAGNDVIRGGAGGDIGFGEDGDDVLVGGYGRDALRGNNGADQLFGGKGRDDLRGGSGNDLLAGGPGRDLLIGGPGRDTFRAEHNSGIDKIKGFEVGSDGDVIDLHNLLNFESGDNIYDFVTLIEANGNSEVTVDVNGLGNPDMIVFTLVGQTGLDLGTLVTDGNIQLADAPSG